MNGRIGSRAATVGTLAVVVLAGSLRAQGLHVTGYGDLEWTAQRQDNPDQKWHNFFDNHHFNMIVAGYVMDNVSVAGEIEYEHAGDEINFEYGYLAYEGIKNLRLIGGKFIIPFNRFNKDLHPTWISKVPGRPLVYDNVFPTTYADVGVWASGAAPLGSGNRFTFDAYVVNGLAGDPDATSFRGLRSNDREKQFKDNNKAIGGRLGLEAAAGLGIGFSGYTSEYAPNLDISFIGGDLDYHLKELELRAEAVHSIQDLSDGSTSTRTGFYTQAAYGLGRLNPKLANLEPVIRYSWVNFPGDTGDKSELAAGISYYVSASAIFRIAYFVNDERGGVDKPNDKVMGQFTVVF
ncbi:MAG: hypothetical protein ACE5HQ_11915 [Gemmatimonadota bacterium]